MLDFFIDKVIPSVSGVLFMYVWNFIINYINNKRIKILDHPYNTTILEFYSFLSKFKGNNEFKTTTIVEYFSVRVSILDSAIQQFVILNRNEFQIKTNQQLIKNLFTDIIKGWAIHNHNLSFPTKWSQQLIKSDALAARVFEKNVAKLFLKNNFLSNQIAFQILELALDYLITLKEDVIPIIDELNGKFYGLEYKGFINN